MDSVQHADGTWFRPPGSNIEMQRGEPVGGSLLLRVRGEIDGSDADALGREMGALISRAGVSGLVLDLTRVEFLGSFAMAALVRASNTAVGHGVRFTVVSGPANRAVRRPITLAGVDALLELVESLDDLRA